MNLKPMVRERDGGKLRHLVDLDDPTMLALCGRPGPWTPPSPQPDGSLSPLKRCEDCGKSHQMRTNHLGGRVWAGA